MGKKQSGKPLDGGSLQPARNDEDLDQSALTEAHGDRAGGKNGTWDSRIRKQRAFMISLIAGQNPSKRKSLEALDRMEAEKPWGKRSGERQDPHSKTGGIYHRHPWAVRGFGEK